MTPYEWRQQFLTNLSLEYADGRPLYQYRVSKEQFEALSELLKLSSLIGTREVLTMRGWDACFVIFAAEWWRRNYVGKWGWDEIFSFVGIDQTHLSTFQRNELIRSGLQKWRREVRKRNDGSRQFLGTIATEGGLPMHQLASSGSGGWLRNILRTTLIKHISKKIPINILLLNSKESIPKSFQSDEVISILDDIVTAISVLRSKHKLADKDSATNWLDEHDSKWREQFPLPLENDVAISLLNDLINVASKEKSAASYSFISSEYSLLQAESSYPELLLEIAVNQFLEIKSIAKLTNTHELPSVCSIEIESSESGLLLQLKGIKTVFNNKETYRLLGKNVITKKGKQATGVISWKLIFSGRVIFSEIITGNILLDTLSPWTFMEVNEAWVFANAATCKVSSTKAIVYVPNGLEYEALGNDSIFSESGDFLDGKLYKLEGTVICKGDNEVFKVTTNSLESIHRLSLSGSLLSEKYVVQHSNPSLVYIGLPELSEENTITGSRAKKHHRLIAKFVGQNSILDKTPHNLEGVCDIAFLDNEKNTVFKKRLGLLNSNFELKLQPINGDSGKIQLAGVKEFEVVIPSNEISSICKKTSSGYEFTIQSKGETPPRNIELVLHKRHSKELTLTIPFPACGAYLFNPAGCRIPMDIPLYLGDLMGYRLRLIEPQNTSIGIAELEFKLHDSELDYQSSKDLHIRERLQLSEQIAEFSIYDWVHHVNSLLNISSNPDATVTASFYRFGRCYFNLTFRRFASMIEPLFEQGVLSLSERARSRYTAEEIAGMKVKALYLQQPAQKYLPLEQATSQQVALGTWSVEPDKRAHGSWIFYPSKSSAINFRPILWNIGDYSPNVQDSTTLEKATAIKDPEQRISAISRVLKEMSFDNKHRSWSYISNLWDKTSNLPLSTFDIWKVSVNQSEFLVALFLQGQIEILERIELELPLLWELIPYKTWLKALINWKKEKEKAAILEQSDLILLLTKKIQSIGKLSIPMQGVEQLLSLELLNISSQEIQFIDRFLPITLEGFKVDLLRQPEHAQWPELLNSELSECFKESSFADIQSLRPPNNFQQSVMYLPGVLAQNMLLGDSFTGQKLTSIDIFKIKQIKQFCPSWFNNTFQILSVWLYTKLHTERKQH